MSITLDSSQADFVRRVGLRRENVGCLNVAGGGKTTTITYAVAELRKNMQSKEILTIAFNRHNKDQLKEKLSGECHIRTMDSLCYMSIFKWLANKKSGNPNLTLEQWGECKDDYKIENLAQRFGVEYWELTGAAFSQEQWQAIEDVQAIATMCMNTLTHPHDWDAIEAMCLVYGLMMPDDDEFTHQAIQYIFDNGMSREMMATSWCYEELRYLAATLPDVYFWQYPAVFVDEAQDLNRAHQVVLSRNLKDKLYFLGDVDQQIYTFMGSDIDAWNALKARTNTHIVNSPISYRLPRAVVEFARQFCPRIQPRPNAPEGDVFYIRERALIENLYAGDVYLSKTNLGAISVALKCLEAGKAAFVKGRSIGADMKGLLTTLEKDKAFRWNDLSGAITRWERQQVAILFAKYGDNAPPEKIGFIHDRGSSLERLYLGALAVGVSDQYMFRQYIDSIFDDSPRREEVVMTSTVHKFKGFENKAVFLHENDLKPRACKSAALQQADLCASNVAATRSLETLFVVQEDPLMKEGGL